MKIPIIFRETGGIERRGEPVSVGLPFAKSAVLYPGVFYLVDQHEKPVPFHLRSLSRWKDGSIKWATATFCADAHANSETGYELRSCELGLDAGKTPGIIISEDERCIIVDTNAARFTFSKVRPGILTAVEVGALEVLAQPGGQLLFTDLHGNNVDIACSSIAVEEYGPSRSVVRIDGHILGSFSSRKANITSRLTFFADKGLIKVSITIHNPKASKHPGGTWDLGDKNSFYFKDLSLNIRLCVPVKDIFYTTQAGMPLKKLSVGDVIIYQDSSGGPNWDSSNHMSADALLDGSFCGSRVTEGGIAADSAPRAEPVIRLMSTDIAVSAVMPEFWQNFPKALETTRAGITMRFFPGQHKGLFELQPGEQKTHDAYIDFAAKGAEDDLGWVHKPLGYIPDKEYYAAAGVVSCLSQCRTSDISGFDGIVDRAVAGEDTFFKRRESIDEYGWRNFGDIFADHEIEHYKDNVPLISHYNNQYDVIYGALSRYIATGNYEWYRIADELARHVIDIDIYHTRNDKAAYNGGLFWHTNHYRTAWTATHRCYSKRYGVGGGPSNEHNYTTGLLLYYYLTGNKQAREAVIGLADWVVNMDDGWKTVFFPLYPGPTGLSSQTADPLYHGPGRGAGNSINALMDAYVLTSNKKYIKEAEKLIKRCIHPLDDPEDYALRDPERRWSYLVFLQVLGKYLDLKEDMGQRDYMYCYARKSLLKYANWMTDNEYIYLDKPEKLEYPTETWAAQEMRKTNVFLYAAKYRDNEPKEKFIERAGYFYHAAIDRLSKFATSGYVRPIAILLACGNIFQYFEKHHDIYAGPMPEHNNFGQPALFMPQKMVAKRRFIVIMAILLIVLGVLLFIRL